MRCANRTWTELSGIELREGDKCCPDLNAHGCLKSGFNVDKACLGLNMFNTGLVVTTLQIAVQEMRLKKSLSFVQLCVVFMVACVLLILANLFRIVLIVLAMALPETWLHDALGMVALVAYVVVPLYFFIRWRVQKSAALPSAPEFFPALNPLKHALLTLFGWGLIFLAFYQVTSLKAQNPVKDPKIETIELAGFSRRRVEDGVMEFRKDGLLIYIKPSSGFLSSDHPPVLCWKGSGFKVEEVSEIILKNGTALFAVLRKDDVVHYTTWWYDNRTVKTADPWKWRTTAGEAFRIVNVTSYSKEDILACTSQMQAKKLF